MNQLTKITIVWELFGQQAPKTDIAKQLKIHRETVHLWIKYKPNEIPELNTYVENFLLRHHYHRPHIGLGMKPPLEES